MSFPELPFDALDEALPIQTVRIDETPPSPTTPIILGRQLFPFLKSKGITILSSCDR